jgi:hypothetical protein
MFLKVVLVAIVVLVVSVEAFKITHQHSFSTSIKFTSPNILSRQDAFTSLYSRSKMSNFLEQRKKSMELSLSGTTGAIDKPSEGGGKPIPLKPTARNTIKKLLPLGAMLFFILFNYTILRDTKDVLVVTAPNSGAEIIPFLKTYVNLPSAIGFTILYSFLSNRMSADKVFYLIITAFLTFFGGFATVICKLIFFVLYCEIALYLMLFF